MNREDSSTPTPTGDAGSAGASDWSPGRPEDGARSPGGSSSDELSWEQVETYTALTPIQQAIIKRIDSVLQTDRDSVVITNACARSSPIVYVTRAWEQMCGYSLCEAAGKNPRLTQGENTSKDTCRGMSLALSERRACKVRLVNYRGVERIPFWNCISMSPITCRGNLLLHIAHLQDYTYRLDRLVTITPLQFCKAGEQFQQTLQLGPRSRGLSRPCQIVWDEGGEQEGGDFASGPSMPKVKKLSFTSLELEPEFLMDRLRDECEQLEIPFQFTEMMSGGAECMRLEINALQTSIGVHAIMHVVPEEAEGVFRVVFTRLRGDVFRFHALYQTFRQRLQDLGVEQPAQAAGGLPRAKLPRAAPTADRFVEITGADGSTSSSGASSSGSMPLAPMPLAPMPRAAMDEDDPAPAAS